MIYVFDNAESYSSHAVYFVEADDDVPESIVLEIMRGPHQYGYEDPNGHIVFRAKRVEWRKGEATPLAEYLRLGHLLDDLEAEDCARKLFPWRPLAESVPPALVQEAFSEWTKSVDNQAAGRVYRRYTAYQLAQIAKRFGIDWKIPRGLVKET